MKIKIEKLIEIITTEVIAELTRLGVEIDYTPTGEKKLNTAGSRRKLCEIIDLKNYKTPVLTENHLESLSPEVMEIEIPKGTIITPGARDLIKKRNLRISSNYKTK
ncbi:MAG: hypothetical protein P4L45_16550 [Ignavibacteriaceae bacterium]|nr:hypothetical protein [Ignavibacteriaceae bacterium]